MRTTALIVACVLLAGCAAAPVRDDSREEKVDLLAPVRSVVEEADRTIVEGDYDAYRPHCCVGFESDEVARRVFDALKKVEYIGYRDLSVPVDKTLLAEWEKSRQSGWELTYEGQVIGCGFRGYRVRYQISKGPEGKSAKIVGVAEDDWNEQAEVTAGILLPVGDWEFEGKRKVRFFPDHKFSLSVRADKMEWEKLVDDGTE